MRNKPSRLTTEINDILSSKSLSRLNIPIHITLEVDQRRPNHISYTIERTQPSMKPIAIGEIRASHNPISSIAYSTSKKIMNGMRNNYQGNIRYIRKTTRRNKKSLF